MADQRSIVIAGAALAGAKAAEGARKAGFDGRVYLIGEEAGLPYERPPLSKGVLRGDDPPELANVRPEDFYKTHEIELVHARVESLDVQSASVHTTVGDFAFTSAVLTTGAKPRRLNVPGADLAGVYYLRTRDSSLQLSAAIKGASHVCVIGGGWIGSEVAASARQMGADVTLVDNGPVLLARVMGEEVGAIFQGLHADNGVDIRNNAGVVELRGSTRVEQVVLADGSTIDADVVVAGIGAELNLELATGAGLKVDNGVVADEYLRTSASNVYVAGDIANAMHPFYDRHVRVEHWDTALNQGKRAGANAAGENVAYDNLPYFYSDQFDLGMEYVGIADPQAEVVFRGDADKRELIVLWHNNGVVTSAMNVNIWDVMDDLKNLVRAKKSVDPARLSDPEVPLSEL